MGKALGLGSKRIIEPAGADQRPLLAVGGDIRRGDWVFHLRKNSLYLYGMKDSPSSTRTSDISDVVTLIG